METTAPKGLSEYSTTALLETQKQRAKRIKQWFELSCNIDNPDHQKALERACMFLYDRQTQAEQAVEDTKENNGIGFNSRDAKFCTIMAQKIVEMRKGHTFFKSLTPKMYGALRKILTKYSRQLAESPK
jgi:hypothetical protein